MKRFSILLTLIFLMSVYAQAQEKAKNRFFVIHEDRVHPSKMMEYEKQSKAFVELLKKHNIQGADYFTLATDDFRYSFISEFEKFADLDENPMSALSELEGKEKMAAVWKGFDQCYDSHVNYVVVLDEELSYMPEGIVVNDGKQFYRDFQYWIVAPQHMEALTGIAKKYKDLCVTKGSKVPYRVYRSGFGTNENFLMVVASGMNSAEFEARRTANNEMMGEEANQLFLKALNYAIRIDRVTGWIRPDLSYSAESQMAKN